jgi:hypothetical protein
LVFLLEKHSSRDHYGMVVGVKTCGGDLHPTANHERKTVTQIAFKLELA